MRPRFRWGADLVVPLLLLLVALFAPPPLMRYLAIGLLAIRVLAWAYVLGNPRCSVRRAGYRARP